MGLGRVLVGLLASVAAAILIVFFVTLGATIGDYSELGDPATYQIVFAVLLSPYTAIQLGNWSVLAAIAVGGLIGGLISKSSLGGLAVGLLSVAVVFILFLGLTIGFDLSLWIAWIEAHAGSILLDLAICLGIWCAVASIGGKLTAD